MISQKIREIEDSIYSLSQEEQKLLLERITKKIKFNSRFSNKNELEEKIREMANDPEIQAEISEINREFLMTEMDGLSDL
jgi:predicted DNA-binding protein YlxM (UPF0122 family)